MELILTVNFKSYRRVSADLPRNRKYIEDSVISRPPPPPKTYRVLAGGFSLSAYVDSFIQWQHIYIILDVIYYHKIFI